MENALKMAGINLRDIQVAQLYDQSTVMEMVSLEDLGFCEPGTAWKSIHESCSDYKGYYQVNGRKLFTNMNGGLKADGNPLGATGGAQLFEVLNSCAAKRVKDKSTQMRRQGVAARLRWKASALRVTFAF